MKSADYIRFNFIGSVSRSILMTGEPAFIVTVKQEIDSLSYNRKHSHLSAISQPYIEKTGATTYKVNYPGYMKIMSAIAPHMKD